MTAPAPAVAKYPGSGPETLVSTARPDDLIILLSQLGGEHPAPHGHDQQAVQAGGDPDPARVRRSLRRRQRGEEGVLQHAQGTAPP